MTVPTVPAELDERFIRKWAGGWQAPDGTVFRFDQDVHLDDGVLTLKLPRAESERPRSVAIN